MSGIDGLADFLLARIADDEAVAQEARQHEYLSARRDSSVIRWENDASGYAFISTTSGRILAECEAKRQIVAEAASWKHMVLEEDCWYTCPAATEERDGGETCNDTTRGGACDCGLAARRRRILGPLATAFADHPDYRQEWKP